MIILKSFTSAHEAVQWLSVTPIEGASIETTPVLKSIGSREPKLSNGNYHVVLKADTTEKPQTRLADIPPSVNNEEEAIKSIVENVVKGILNRMIAEDPDAARKLITPVGADGKEITGVGDRKVAVQDALAETLGVAGPMQTEPGGFEDRRVRLNRAAEAVRRRL